ncbi:MAG: glycine/betaine ABC transporter [Bacteroidetes bacterium SW_10_40_5]|nr:MAG: glycine/betaine ABC transporter [Bacteroidetes bacterium SW_10_40_5]
MNQNRLFCKKFFYLIVAIPFLLSLSNCQNETNKNEQGKGTNLNTLKNTSSKGNSPYQKALQDTNTLDIFYVKWIEGVAMTHLVKQIIQDHYSQYNVKLHQSYLGPIYDSLALGTHELFLDAWIDVDQSNPKTQEFMDLGINFQNARFGLAVPSYVKTNTISELNDNKAVFNNEIIGIDKGSRVMNLTKKAKKAYDLELELKASSGPIMTNLLKKAIEEEKPIVVTGWKPHWKFPRFDLKLLEDPKNVYGKKKNIHTLARKEFDQDFPEVATFLKKFQLNEVQMGSLIKATVKYPGEPEKGIKEWYHDHKELVKSWVKNQKAS